MPATQQCTVYPSHGQPDSSKSEKETKVDVAEAGEYQEEERGCQALHFTVSVTMTLIRRWTHNWTLAILCRALSGIE